MVVALHGDRACPFESPLELTLSLIALMILPTVIVSLLAQKHIGAGLTVGAIKG